MESGTVLVAGVDESAVTGIEATLEEANGQVEVRRLSELGELYEELCRSVVHCLVLTEQVEGHSAIKIVQGARTLYPDLPVVVVGLSPEDVPPDVDLRAVDATEPTDETVAVEIAAVLEEGMDSDAARPPSRMETLLLSMFDQFPVHLYAKDDGARHVLTSRYSMSPTELIGLTDLDYVELPEEHRAAAYRDDMDIVEKEESRLDLEEYTDYIDSHTLTSKVPWYHEDDDVVGLVGITRDITERKKREHAARRQQELLVKLAVLAAHEFRNELQVALGRLEMVEEDPDQIDVIEQSHDHLTKIVDKVVDLASRERHARSESEVWLSTLSREVWDTLDVANASLAIAHDARIVVDPESTSLFLQILFDNALEHVGPEVNVTVGAMEDGFYVADDGPGIEVEPPEHVFDAGYSSEPENTGFGLFVARSVADEHNWRVDIAESSEGGARFEMTGMTVKE